jgi:hypothetical protein
MKSTGKLLTLDQPVTYEIRVWGHLKESWRDWIGATTTLRGPCDDGPPVSVITGTFDQAALHGLLRRLYSLGFPLISVNWVAE